MKPSADLALTHGKVFTGSRFVEAVAIKDGRIIAAGANSEVASYLGDSTQHIDLNGRTAIPGLNDSHIHVIRGGLNYNLELRWDGVPSLADGLRMLRDQARRTPAGRWVRIVGGWSEFQFAERRMPTLEEINAAAPDTPVFVLHLYARALLNQAALRALGYDRNTPNPPGGEIQRDAKGDPTGLLIARPNATILYATLAKAPELPPEYQLNSTRHFMRELNRLGLTSIIDAGGGFQNYPDDYNIIEKLHADGELTLRLAFNLFTQKPKQERDDFTRWIKSATPGQGDDFYRLNGAGEMLVFSAADFEDFLEPRPDLVPEMETELKDVVTLLAQNRWPFRIHATYDESIQRFLNVFEDVNKDVPLDGLHWFFDHAETISDRSIERVRALGGGIAVQHRMAFQGEYFINRYGAAAAERTPPVRRMLEMGVPVGLGTDATRVASYNPWVSLYWMISGRTVGGTQMYKDANLLGREEALRLYTQGSAWFSNEVEKKGTLDVGQFADIAVLSEDFFSIEEERIKGISSVLTILGGKVVYGDGEFKPLAPAMPPVLPEWSPVGKFGGAQGSEPIVVAKSCSHAKWTHEGHGWSSGCGCWAF